MLKNVVIYGIDMDNSNVYVLVMSMVMVVRALLELAHVQDVRKVIEKREPNAHVKVNVNASRPNQISVEILILLVLSMKVYPQIVCKV